MSDHGAHHHEGENTGEIKSKTAFTSSFWVVFILAGMFIAALNFIKVMGADDAHHGAAHKEPASTINVHEENRPIGPLDDTANRQHVPTTHEEAGAPEKEAGGHH